MYKEICKETIGERTDYFHHWYHNKPLIITSERRGELRRMCRCLIKCLHYIGEHYRDYLGLMPFSDHELAILDYQCKYPYKLGTYHPDYLISKKGELKFVEITCRFFGHAIWLSYFSDVAADRFMERFPGETRECHYEEMWRYMAELVPEGKPIFVLKSSDRSSELAHYKAFYERLGHTVTVYEAEEVEPNIETWRDGFLISALNVADINTFSMDTIHAMIDARMVNDFRTILLAHDKRFCALIFEDSFTDKCLSKEETEFMRTHTIETYLYGKDADRWEDARHHKDNYILKHYRLGKSVSVYAGTMTSEEEWQTLFDSENLEDMILQPFMDQRTYLLTWEGTTYDEYICGQMLTVDDECFDSGLVRTSSAPVTNKVDDRKMCIVETDSEILMKEGVVL